MPRLLSHYYLQLAVIRLEVSGIHTTCILRNTIWRPGLKDKRTHLPINELKCDTDSLVISFTRSTCDSEVKILSWKATATVSPTFHARSDDSSCRCHSSQRRVQERMSERCSRGWIFRGRVQSLRRFAPPANEQDGKDRGLRGLWLAKDWIIGRRRMSRNAQIQTHKNSHQKLPPR